MKEIRDDIPDAVWDDIRSGQYDVVNGRALDGGGMQLLFASLACSANIVRGGDLCEPEDRDELLERCVAMSNRVCWSGGHLYLHECVVVAAHERFEDYIAVPETPSFVHPLYVVGHLRTLDSNAPLKVNLFRSLARAWVATFGADWQSTLKSLTRAFYFVAHGVCMGMMVRYPSSVTWRDCTPSTANRLTVASLKMGG